MLMKSNLPRSNDVIVQIRSLEEAITIFSTPFNRFGLIPNEF